MIIDLKFNAENHKLKVLNELDKMIALSTNIEDFKKINFDFINYNDIYLKT